MSYDLFFRSPEGSRLPTLTRLKKHFHERLRYGVSDGEADYTNPDTGVYFSFAFLQGEPKAPPSVSFKLDFNRPRTFALEAEPELSALVEAFGFEVADPQEDGMGEGPYSAEGFLRGWDRENRLAVGSFLSAEGSQPPLTLPQATIERAWRWNFTRDELTTDETFAPRVSFGVLGGEAVTACIWGGASSVFLPETDYVVLMRGDPENPDACALPAAELKALLKGHKRVAAGSPLPYRELRWAEPPRDIQRAFERFEGKPVDQLDLRLIAPDQVLDREVVEAATRKKRKPS